MTLNHQKNRVTPSLLPSFFFEVAAITEQRPLGDNFFFLTLHASKIASVAQPGQFVHVALPHHFLKRPFSLFSVRSQEISIFYRVVGKGTATLSQLPPDTPLELTGPLGTPFPILSAKTPLFVGGGYGIGPLLFLLKRGEWQEKYFFYGARSAAFLKLRAELEKEAKVSYTTEDGSFGQKGLVTEAVAHKLSSEKKDFVLYACGPMPMLKQVANLARAQHIPCYVSVEARMGCGIGVCLGCCLPVKRDGQIRYRRVCTEGPVFPAEELF